ncbi:aminoglycoside phosphotransferase (APT) family kinase protein [Microvirga lupini]|uniref:Aminoglycoside phosphotransferase (APT) family kinase protein n=1 Tax=Microvirga lupini TaxID=420324 RepID=A0A7W4VN80_9HYPH|nr:phosphotransferase family protein [Microvirga lupini]MBB3020233.1 aminoglycoside phosphotransferase (APT) family kinase protein [Microvirga lupini]
MTAQAAAHLDTERLGPYLAAQVPGFGRLVSAEKFAGGQSNPTFLITSTEGRFVLRRKPSGALLKSAHAVDREYRVMAALAQTDVPVPRVLHLCVDETIIGSMFFVMDYVEGRIFWDGRLPELQPAERSGIYDSMNAALAALHQVDPAVVGLADYGKPGSYFERQIARWTGQYRASETHPIPAMDELIAWLDGNMPVDDGRVSLVHGDYRLDNMIFESAGTRILAVLDWELSTLGHPLADLAYQCMQWRLPSEGAFRGLGGIDRKAHGIPTEDEYVDLYCRRTGFEVVGHWPFYLAFSFFRLAAILQGVYKRSLDGNASNPERARRMGEAVPMMAGMALEVVGAR